MKKLNLMGWFLIAIFFIALAIVGADVYLSFTRERRECRKLMSVVSSIGVKSYLLQWVDKNANIAGVEKYTVSLPGSLSNVILDRPVDWQFLHFRAEQSKVALIGRHNKYEAAFFYEGRRSGILVPFNQELGDVTKYFVDKWGEKIDSRVYIICDLGDYDQEDRKSGNQ
ncbi:hypothetical protein K0B96_10455 [Horticoccus luteus]|uniref:Uncharacterized protein n=1 Tax=Horticoccus luteus TaxID=2862869 RepID=A0A8F9TRN9_9BACT|nr:hypothetical protein [Horticoccus luteus]QYM77746.1 hypothetical protein K0B96_10455 [Horticoccus luteus]